MVGKKNLLKFAATLNFLHIVYIGSQQGFDPTICLLAFLASGPVVSEWFDGLSGWAYVRTRGNMYKYVRDMSLYPVTFIEYLVFNRRLNKAVSLKTELEQNAHQQSTPENAAKMKELVALTAKLNWWRENMDYLEKKKEK